MAFGKQLLEWTGTLHRTGFISVFLSGVLGKVLSFFGGIIIVRVLSKEDYGLYSYVMNCYAMLVLLNDCGCGDAMLQFRSENHNNPTLYNDFFTFSLKCAIRFSAIASLLLLLSPMFYPFHQETASLLTQCLFLLPIISTANRFIQLNLRVEMQNKKYAILSFADAFIHYGFILPMSYFWSVKGAVFANYAIALGVLFFGLSISREYLRFDWNKCTLNVRQKKAFLKFAFASQINNSVGQLLHLFDVFVIGMIVTNNQIIASYKVALVIPQALMFIPNTVLVYAVPWFARNFNNVEWISRNFKRIVWACAGMNGPLVIGGIGGASLLIPLIFGNGYADAIPCFVILLIAFFFHGTFQVPAANIMYTQHKVKANIAITLGSSILNCILDVWLVSAYGSIGAAFATLAVSIVASVMSYGYMKYWLYQQGV